MSLALLAAKRLRELREEEINERRQAAGLPPLEPLEAVKGLDSKDPMQDIMENKNLIFQVAIIAGMLKFAKMPGGMRTIQVLGKAAIDGIFRTTNSLGKASAANYIAAWANPVLISGIMERFGLLPPAFNVGYHDAISRLTGYNVFTGVIELIFGKTPMDGAFPSSLDFGTEGGELPAGSMAREVAAAEMAGAGAGAGAAAGAVPIV